MSTAEPVYVIMCGQVYMSAVTDALSAISATDSTTSDVILISIAKAMAEQLTKVKKF